MCVSGSEGDEWPDKLQKSRWSPSGIERERREEERDTEWDSGLATHLRIELGLEVSWTLRAPTTPAPTPTVPPCGGLLLWTGRI